MISPDINRESDSGPQTIGGPKITNPDGAGITNPENPGSAKNPRHRNFRPRGGPDTIGGPKITGSINQVVTKQLEAGTQWQMQIYNNTSEQFGWKIALPEQLPAWLTITPDSGTLAAMGQSGSTTMLTVSVMLPEGGPPQTVSITFGWNPPQLYNGDTLVVTVTQ